jgi:hypothetical protein
MTAEMKVVMVHKSFIPFTLLVLLGALSSIAHAQSVTWTFKDVTWVPQSGSGSPARPPLTGSFTVDAATGALISWDITGLAHYFTSAYGRGEYVPSLPGAPPYYDFTVGIGPTDPTRSSLLVSLPNVLPAAGGTVNLFVAPFPYGAQEFCSGACLGVGSYQVVSGAITTLPQLQVDIAAAATVKPSILSSLEPHACNSVPVTITCKDPSGAATDCTVDLTLTSNEAPASNGGHLHATGRPLGNLLLPTAGPYSASSCPFTSPSGGVLATQGTGKNGDPVGTLALVYLAPETTGTVTVSAKASGSGQSARASTSIVMQRAQYNALSNIPGLLTLAGRTPGAHVDNHFGTQALIVSLSASASAVQTWNATAPPRCPPAGAQGPCQTTIPLPLYVNDMSLVWGGILDYTQSWQPPHTSHRRGTSADIGSTGQQDPVVPYSPFSVNIPVYARNALKLIFQQHGLTIASEAGCPAADAQTCNHWHVNSGM